MMDTILQDIRYAARQLRHAPGFTLVATLTLALGIGATTAIFSVVDALLLRSLPYAEEGRIVLLAERSATDPARQGSTSFMNYLDWRAQAESFEALGIYQGWSPSLTGLGEAERLRAAAVTSGVMDALGVQPILGRAMRPSDNETGAPSVALVSHTFWQDRLGGSESAIGRSITLNGLPAEVIGVLPAGFRGPGELDAQVFGNTWLDPRDTRGSRYLRVLGLLRSDVGLAAARAEMATVSRRLADAYPATNRGMEAVVTPLRDSLIGDTRGPLWLLFGAAWLVLLIACGNLSNLLIVRGVARSREFAVRAALGSSRSRAIRQLLTESLLLAVAGGIGGWMLAAWGAPALIAMGPEFLRSQPFTLDARVLAFAITAAGASAVFAGLLPAIRTTRVDLQGSLKDATRGGTARSGNRLRSSVSVLQLAMALTLLCGAGLLIKSFLKLQQVEPGLRPERLLVMSLNLPGQKYPEAARPVFFNALVERVRALPGVEDAAVNSIMPFGGDWDRVALDVVGRAAGQGTERPEADRYIVTPGYHAALGIALRQGRLLEEADRFDGELVALVDEVFARRIAPDGNALGLQLALPGRDAPARVVGIVAHVKHYGLDASSNGQVYMSQSQYPWRWMNIAVRTRGEPLAMTAQVRGAVRALDAEQPVFGITSMDRLMGDRSATRRFAMTLLGLFAAVALILAILGLYGVMSFAVTARTREIGIRVALGARSAEIARMVVRRGALLAAAGIGLGLAGALLLGRSLRAMLFGVTPADAGVLALVAALLLAVSLVASWLPARRAARVDPMVALRNE